MKVWKTGIKEEIQTYDRHHKVHQDSLEKWNGVLKMEVWLKEKKKPTMLKKL